MNAYTQFHWRGDGVLADSIAIRAAFAQIRRQFTGRRIGYPRIGAGLARGDWSDISAIIAEELACEDHTLVEFTPINPDSPAVHANAVRDYLPHGGQISITRRSRTGG